MTRYETILVEHDGPVSWIVFNRPEKLNAMNDKCLVEFGSALESLKTSGGPVIGIRGAGRAFSAGYDISAESSEVGEAAERDITQDRDRLVGNIELFFRIWDHPKPVIAAIHGYCLAGATQLAVFCDLTIVAEDAQIGLPSIPIGGGYITPLWSWLIGPKRAKQMSFVASSKIDGKTAVEWNWANYAVPEAELFAEVRRLADEMSKIPSEILAVKKVAVNRQWEIMGFRAGAPLGADYDAMLHYSGAVQKLHKLIVDNGLKEAIRKFDNRDW